MTNNSAHEWRRKVMASNENLVNSLAYDLVHVNDTVSALADAICEVTNGISYTVDYNDGTIRVDYGETHTLEVSVSYSIDYALYKFRIVNACVENIIGPLSDEEYTGNYYQPYVPVYINDEDMYEYDTDTYRQLLYMAVDTVRDYYEAIGAR